MRWPHLLSPPQPHCQHLPHLPNRSSHSPPPPQACCALEWHQRAGPALEGSQERDLGLPESGDHAAGQPGASVLWVPGPGLSPVPPALDTHPTGSPRLGSGQVPLDTCGQRASRTSLSPTFPISFSPPRAGLGPWTGFGLCRPSPGQSSGGRVGSRGPARWVWPLPRWAVPVPTAERRALRAQPGTVHPRRAQGRPWAGEGGFLVHAQDMRPCGGLAGAAPADGAHALSLGRHQGVIGLLRAAGGCLSPRELEDSGTELCR